MTPYQRLLCRVKVAGGTFKLDWETGLIGYDSRDGFYDYPTTFKRVVRMYRFR